MEINGDIIILHKSELPNLCITLIDKLEQIGKENGALKFRLEEFKGIQLAEIKNSSLMAENYHNICKLN